MTLIRQVFAFRKRFKDDDLWKLDKIIKDEMISRDSQRETQKEKMQKWKNL